MTSQALGVNKEKLQQSAGCHSLQAVLLRVLTLLADPTGQSGIGPLSQFMGLAPTNYTKAAQRA